MKKQRAELEGENNSCEENGIVLDCKHRRWQKSGRQQVM